MHRNGRLSAAGPHLRVLSTADASGGLWQYHVDLAAGLAGIGIQTVLAVTGPALPEEQRAAALAVPGLELVDTGLSIDGLTDSASALRAAGSEISDLAAARGADIVQLNSPALAAETRFRVPVVAVHHVCLAAWWEAVHGCALPAEFAWRTELVRAGLQAADTIVVPSAAFGAAVARACRLASPPRTVHYGRAPVALPPYAPHDFVFTAGRLWDEGKNLDLLDEAAGRIPVPVRAAGPIEGPNGAAVVFDNIDCVGNLRAEELAGWLLARPVFVSAALHEPFGLSVLEAAAAGCPLILSDIPVFRELWEDIAIFVPARDGEAFTRAIGRLVADDFERAVMSRASSERAKLYSRDAMAAQMAAIYRSLLPALHRPVLAAARAAA
jgi:glycosyltransferase involved in cell wall biosynthesis